MEAATTRPPEARSIGVGSLSGATEASDAAAHAAISAISPARSPVDARITARARSGVNGIAEAAANTDAEAQPGNGEGNSTNPDGLKPADPTAPRSSGASANPAAIPDTSNYDDDDGLAGLPQEPVHRLELRGAEGAGRGHHAADQRTGERPAHRHRRLVDAQEHPAPVPRVALAAHVAEPFQPVDQRGDRRRVQPQLPGQPAGGGRDVGPGGVQQGDQRAQVGGVQAVAAGELGAQQVQLHGEGTQPVDQPHARVVVVHPTSP